MHILSLRCTATLKRGLSKTIGGDNNDDIHEPLQQAASTPCPTCPKGGHVNGERCRYAVRQNPTVIAVHGIIQKSEC